MATSEPESPKISFDEDDKRPYVSPYGEQPKFTVGEKVYLVQSGTRTGPYLVASISGGKCTLSLTDGTPINNGQEIDVTYVDAA